MNKQVFKAMVIKAVRDHVASQPELITEETNLEISRNLFHLFDSAEYEADAVKVMIPVDAQWNVPKVNTDFRIGPVVGVCREHIFQDNVCTHLIMTVANDTIDRLGDTLYHFGAVECPHTKDKYCNVQFEKSGCNDCEFAPKPVKHGYSVLHESFFNNGVIEDGLTDEYTDGEVYPHTDIAKAWLDRPTFNMPKGFYYLVSVAYREAKEGKANYGGDIVLTKNILNISLLCVLD